MPTNQLGAKIPARPSSASTVRASWQIGPQYFRSDRLAPSMGLPQCWHLSVARIAGSLDPHWRQCVYSTRVPGLSAVRKLQRKGKVGNLEFRKEAAMLHRTWIYTALALIFVLIEGVARAYDPLPPWPYANWPEGSDYEMMCFGFLPGSGTKRTICKIDL